MNHTYRKAGTITQNGTLPRLNKLNTTRNQKSRRAAEEAGDSAYLDQSLSMATRADEVGLAVNPIPMKTSQWYHDL